MLLLQMKGQQDHIRRIFDTKNIEYKEIDIAAPQCVDDKKFMQEVVRRSNPEIQALPPQLFQDETYRGVSSDCLVSVKFCHRLWYDRHLATLSTSVYNVAQKSKPLSGIIIKSY